MCTVAVRNQLAVTPPRSLLRLRSGQHIRPPRADQQMSQVGGERSRTGPFWLALPLSPVCREGETPAEIVVRNGPFESEKTKLGHVYFPFRVYCFQFGGTSDKT